MYKKYILVTIFILVVSSLLKAQQFYSNPILPGFHPDPSICRVGEQYFLITSTFEYFPGIPIYQSTDLVNWKLIGHVLNRPEQLNLSGFAPSDGIYAPTIRFHNGLFYVVTSIVMRNPRNIKNIVMTAEDPAGPWSDPIIISNSDDWSIDPSLFFDDDGRCYFTANRIAPGGEKYPGHRQIAMQELDLKSMKLVGETTVLTDGALKFAGTAEAPHIYKKDGHYFLLVAEGGTGPGHAVTIFKSDKVGGPYKGYSHNPILTHRHLQNSIDIRNVGHADMVQTQNGDWWMVCLAVRPKDGFTVMGRETFLVPVRWEQNRFPIVNPGIGLVQMKFIKPDLPFSYVQSNNFVDHFDHLNLDLQWNFIRTPEYKFFSLKDKEDYIRIFLKPNTIDEISTPAFIGKRITSHDFIVRSKLHFKPKLEEKAGIVLFYDNNNNIKFLLQKNKIILIEREKGQEKIVNVVDYDEYAFNCKIEAKDGIFSFYYRNNNGSWQKIGKSSGNIIESWHFTGAYVGVYGTSSGNSSNNYFDVDWFEYLED